MTIRPALLAAAVSVALAGPAWAQNPSADQIINSLRPTGGQGGGIGGGTRGIRPVGPAAAPAPAPATPAAAPGAPARPRTPGVATPAQPAPATTAAAPSVNLTVEFASGSATLTPAATRTLTELGRALSSNALGTYRFRIEGHTDTVGGADANRALSERRAQAVVTFLASRFAIDTARLDAVGMGEDGLLVQTPANTPEPKNRRVQVINLGA